MRSSLWWLMMRSGGMSFPPMGSAAVGFGASPAKVVGGTLRRAPKSRARKMGRVTVYLVGHPPADEAADWMTRNQTRGQSAMSPTPGFGEESRWDQSNAYREETPQREVPTGLS